VEGGDGKDHKDRSLLDTNKAIYQRERTVKEYALADAELTVQENVCIEYLPQAQRNCVLDIGIGAGRTVRPLSERFKRYVGIDYSAPMIREARRRFPTHGANREVIQAKFDVGPRCLRATLQRRDGGSNSSQRNRFQKISSRKMVHFRCE